MTVFDLEPKEGSWFDMEGGGRVQLRRILPNVWADIMKKTVRKKVEYKKVEGTPSRFEHEEIDIDLQNGLFWDAIILAWENFFDSKESPIPCTKENKSLLMTRSVKFSTFVQSSLKKLAEDEEAEAERASKN